jgi:MarR family transcriptional regulator, negative regulator of the multidrug operon emrRAB
MHDHDHDHVANLLGALAVAVTDRILAAAAERTGLDPSAAAAVLTIAERPRRSVEHLSVTVGLTHSGAVRLVSRLEEADLARRVHGEDDRRTRALELTDNGRRTAREIREARLQVLREILRRYDDRSSAEVSEVLEGLLRAMPEDRVDAWHICRLCDHATCTQQTCPVDQAVT